VPADGLEKGLRLTGGRMERFAHTEGYDAVITTVDDHQRQRRKRSNRVDRIVRACEQPLGRPCEQPGQSIALRDVSCHRTVAGERGLDNGAGKALAMFGMEGEVAQAESAAETLSEQMNGRVVAVLIQVIEQPDRAGPHIFEYLGKARLPVGKPVASIVDREDAIARCHQPEHAAGMRADVLGIAVQVIERTQRCPFGFDQPAVQADTVACGDGDIAIRMAPVDRRCDQRRIRIKDETGAACDEQSARQQ